MTILLTGAAGYIGSATAELLLKEGHTVRGVDLLMHGGQSLVHLADHPRFEFVQGDIRNENLMRGLLPGVDGVVHLAAIVGDPACRMQPEATRSINLEASVDLHRWAVEYRVPRFAFASTCSNYGKMEGDGYVDETSPLNPVSLYAETKVAFERHLMSHPAPETSAVILRFSTVYGHSPRVRFDLTVNEFTKDVARGRVLEIFGEQFWRPYCHVRDLARSVLAGLTADLHGKAADVFNVGDTSENYTKRMIAEAIREQLPEAQVRYVPRDEDPRDYRVNFDKIRAHLGFEITRRVPDGIAEIARLIASGLIPDTEAQAYYNIPPPSYASRPETDRKAIAPAASRRLRTVRRRRQS